ncbi:hypothetical protein BDA99DRAFT_528368, partial [Phascolomyces articulosus]
MSNNNITLTIFNTTGLNRQAINSILSFTPSTHLLFLTETWLLSPNRYPTNWKQYHEYGDRPTSTSRRGDTDSNTRGDLMLHWIESHQLKIWNAELAYGKPTFLRPPGSSIIDIYMSTNNCINPTLNISDNLSLGSNHKMVHFSFDIVSNIPLSSPPQQLRRIWRLSKIKDPAIQEEYKSTINNKLQALNNKLQQLIDRPQTQTYLLP